MKILAVLKSEFSHREEPISVLFVKGFDDCFRKTAVGGRFCYFRTKILRR